MVFTMKFQLLFKYIKRFGVFAILLNINPQTHVGATVQLVYYIMLL